MPDWKSKESHTRLLAAMVAATPDMKLDYRKIASMYGEGATYDSIEGRFRIIKKEAAAMKNEIESGLRPEAPARGGNNGSTPKKPRTPKKTASQDGVLGGRVSKSTNGSPTKRRSAATIKNELLESSTSSSCSGDGVQISESDSLDDSIYSSFQTTGSTPSQMVLGLADDFVLPQYQDYVWDEHVV